MPILNSAYWQERLDIFAAILGALLGFVITLFNFMYSNEYMITIGPMLIIVCLAYLLLRRKLLSPSVEHKASHRFTLLVTIVFWLVFAGSIFSLNTGILHRPLVYFILTAVAASTIAIQILYCRREISENLILFEILAISLSVTASAYFVFPTLPGSDPWGHLNYIEDFVNLGHIESTHGDIYYLNYPIMHLEVVSTKLITSVDYKTAMFLGAGVPLVLSIVFVFLIARTLADSRVGLLAALLVGLSDFHLQWSIQIIAMSLGIALFSIIAYLVIRYGSHTKWSITVLTILLMLELVITHTVSAFIMLCFLVFLLVGMQMHRYIFARDSIHQQGIITVHILTTFAVAMLAYWMFAGYVQGSHFFDQQIRWLYNSIVGETGFLERAPSNLGTLSDRILDIAGFLLLYLFCTIGCLLWFSRNSQNRHRVALVVVTILLTAFALSFPVFGMRNIMPYRWYAFIYVVLGAIAAVGVLTIVEHLRNRALSMVVLTITVFTISFLGITDNQSNMDSPVYSEQLNQRIVYTDSEMALALSQVVNDYDGRILTDHQYGSRVLRTHLGMQNVSYDMQDDEAITSSLIIWRDIMATRPIQLSDTEVILGYGYEQEVSSSHDLIYVNTTGEIFLPRIAG